MAKKPVKQEKPKTGILQVETIGPDKAFGEALKKAIAKEVLKNH